MIATVLAVYRSQVLVGGLSELMQYLPINPIVVGNTNIDLCPENIQSSSRIEYKTVLNSLWLL